MTTRNDATPVRHTVAGVLETVMPWHIDKLLRLKTLIEAEVIQRARMGTAYAKKYPQGGGEADGNLKTDEGGE